MNVLGTHECAQHVFAFDHTAQHVRLHVVRNTSTGEGG